MLHKTSLGFKLHKAHEDSNAVTQATMHVTLTERADGGATALYCRVGCRSLELPSERGALTAFIGTFTHKTEETKERRPGSSRAKGAIAKDQLTKLKAQYPGRSVDDAPYAQPSERMYASSYVRLDTERLAELAWALRCKHGGIPAAGLFPRWTAEEKEQMELLHAAGGV